MSSLAHFVPNWTSFWRMGMVALPLLQPGNGLPAENCAEVRAKDPTARDGTYTLTLGRQEVSMYCHDMEGRPLEYLTLPKTGSTTNYSHFGQGQHASFTGLTTWFTKVRLDLATLTLVLDDTTFSTSDGWAMLNGEFVSSLPLANASDCVAAYSQGGKSNIDLTGTPFDIVPDQFQVSGNKPRGSTLLNGSQIVDLAGGGGCGGISAVSNRLRLDLQSPPDPLPELVHSYSFTASAADSVSGANGSLEGGATIADGEAFLNGRGSYVSLPIGGTIAQLQDATFEAWVEWGMSPDRIERIFDFNDNAQSSMYLEVDRIFPPVFVITTPQMGRVVVRPTYRVFPIGEFTHVAVSIDHTAGLIRLYMNGLEVAREATRVTPADLGVTSNNWLGRMLEARTPFLTGSISEFRVYRKALSPSLIALHFNMKDTHRNLETGFDSRPTDPTNQDIASFSFRASGQDTYYLCSLDEAPFQLCTSPFTLPSLAEGSHTFRVQARDTVGNVEASPSVYSWIVDKTPPDTSIVSTPDPATRQRTPSFSFASNDPGASFECSIDQAPYTPCPSEFPSLTDGEHHLSVRARDAANNVDPDAARYSWTVDNEAPQEPSLQEPAPSQVLFTETPRFWGTAEPGSIVTLLVDGVEVGSVKADALGAWDYPFSSPLTWGVHRASAIATDKAGNISPLLPEVLFSTSQRSVYGLGCSAQPSSWQGSWLWALLVLGLLRPRSRPSRRALGSSPTGPRTD
ncbi:LamG-like jellyroll fold domain-containing protein [Hyalangium versicolor]|uniref:LamG-like jellyroll fold domain-containing protein n=1 Tax=Hyalangium versicolor TaxID=2861190 RepID=UPI001CCBAF2A|nr:LamG-like jellyroll fold domain-containing protein [Hyalangium versicolor]